MLRLGSSYPLEFPEHWPLSSRMEAGGVYLWEIWTTWKEEKTKDINIRDLKMKYSNQITLVWGSQTTGHAYIHTEELPTSFQTLIFNNKQTSKAYSTSEESYDLEEAEPM